VNGGAEGSRRDVFVEWGLLLLKEILQRNITPLDRQKQTSAVTRNAASNG
jgi:hypothetical protein